MPSLQRALFDFSAQQTRERPRGSRSGARRLAVGGALLSLSGLVIGVRPLFVCGLMLVIAALAAVVWVTLGVRRLSVTRRLVTRRVVEGELMEATLVVHGRSAALMGAQIVDAFSGELLRTSGPGWVPAGRGSRELRLVRPVPRRGLHTLAPPLAALRDPFGLAAAYARPSGEADQLIVLPRTEQVDWSASGLRSVGGEREAGRSVFGAGEVDGLRDYSPGTPATRIHWPSLAHGSGLLERRLISAAETRPTLVIDARCRREALDRLDTAVRAAASLILQLAGRGGCTVLLPEARMPFTVGHNLQGWTTVHTELALVEAQWYDGPPPAIRPENVRGPIVYVSAAAIQLPGITRASTFPVIHVVPLGDSPPAGPVLFSVAGCVAYRARGSAPARRAA